LLPTQPYKAGVPPPPHLSPFVDNVKEGYIPTRQREIATLKGEDIEFLSEEEEEEVVEAPKKTLEAAKETKESKKKAAKVEPKQAPTPAPVEKVQSKQQAKGDADSSSSDESDVEQEERNKKAKNLKVKKELKKEQEELGKILMTKKQRQMLDQVEKTHSKKKEFVNKLKEKKQRIEAQASKKQK
jgi:pescadillo protein